jgi:hypothetical protein
MIFMGAGITAARDTSRAETVDFAPTMATVLGIPYPSDLDGKVLTAIGGIMEYKGVALNTGKPFFLLEQPLRGPVRPL